MTHYHFVGIGGIGMSGLARILLQQGVKVSGSDLNPSVMTKELEDLGATIFMEHRADLLEPSSVLVYSSAISKDNPEIKCAGERSVLCLHRSELLHQLMKPYHPLLVTGMHGKTTTSALLVHLLVDAGWDPSYAVGGWMTNVNGHAASGKGKYFIAEADESDGSFLKYDPFGAIITNIDRDHLDYWKNLEQITLGFEAFGSKVQSPHHLFWCGDDEILRSLKLQGFSYGFGENNALYIQNFIQKKWKTFFDLRFQGEDYLEIELPLVGAHNVLNAAAIFGLGRQLKLSEEQIRKAFCSFRGVSRRAEFKGGVKGISIFDDYGHHPTEIFATLRAMKQAVAHHRLIVAFQPHRYSRTRDCLHEFGQAFEGADQLILTDIYHAGEPPIEGICIDLLLKTLQTSSCLDAKYVPRLSLTAFLSTYLQPGDVLVTMGAGDITNVGPEILQNLSS